MPWFLCFYHIMKTFIISLLAFLLTSFSIADKKSSTKWVISQNSILTVNGSTNINKFSCAIVQYPKTDTVNIIQDQQRNILLNGIVNIDVKNFDCKNIMMTKQLRKTLREVEYPQFKIKFLSLKGIFFAKQKSNMMKGLVEICIAGIAKRYEVNYQLNYTKNELLLSGNQSINFSDFNLEPPKKMGKLIQAKDQLVVVFSLSMESVLND